MGKEISHSYNYDRSKICTPTLKKHVLSCSAAHTSYTNNLTRTITSYQVENEDSTEIQNNKDTSKTDNIHSCVTPLKQNYSVQVTDTSPNLTPLNTTLPIASDELQKNNGITPSW